MPLVAAPDKTFVLATRLPERALQGREPLFEEFSEALGFAVQLAGKLA